MTTSPPDIPQHEIGAAKMPLGLGLVIPLLVIGNLYGVFTLLFQWEEFARKYPFLGPDARALLISCAVASLLGLFGAWIWKKWGLILVSIAYLVMVSADIYFVMTYHIFVTTVSFALLWIFAWPVWKNFK